MMGEEALKFWLDAQTQAIRRLATAQESIKQSYRDLWKTLIGIHGVILGISVALLAYKGTKPNIFLISTWVCEVVSIFLGFIVFKIDIDIESVRELKSFLFSYDMNEISMREARGDFVRDEDRREGLIVAALVKYDPDQPFWTDEAKKAAETYGSELRVSNLFKEPRMGKFAKHIRAKHPLMVSLFYILSCLSFALLLLSILLK